MRDRSADETRKLEAAGWEQRGGAKGHLAQPQRRPLVRPLPGPGQATQGKIHDTGRRGRVNPREILDELDRHGAVIYWDQDKRMLKCDQYIPEDLQDAIVAHEEELLKIVRVDWQDHGTSARFPKDDPGGVS